MLNAIFIDFVFFDNSFSNKPVQEMFITFFFSNGKDDRTSPLKQLSEFHEITYIGIETLI